MQNEQRNRHAPVGLACVRPGRNIAPVQAVFTRLHVRVQKGAKPEQDAEAAQGRQDQGPAPHIGQHQDRDPEGSYIMPADSTQQIGPQSARQAQPPVPVNVSSGGSRCRRASSCGGRQALNQMRDATHTPTAAGFKPQRTGSALCPGGSPAEEERRRLPEPAGRHLWRHDRPASRKHSSAAGMAPPAVSYGDLHRSPLYRAKPGGQHQYRHRRPARRPGVHSDAAARAGRIAHPGAAILARVVFLDARSNIPRLGAIAAGWPLSARRAWSTVSSATRRPHRAAGFSAARTGAAGFRSRSRPCSASPNVPHRPARQMPQGEPGCVRHRRWPPGRRPARTAGHQRCRRPGGAGGPRLR